MLLKKCAYILIGLVVLFSCAALSIHRAAANQASSWFGADPVLANTGDTTAAEASASSPKSCINMVVPVVRVVDQELLTNNETHCMAQTSEGLIDTSIGTVNAVFQPNGYNKAYPIDTSGIAGNPVLTVVPDYPSAFLTHGDPSWPGSDVGFYKDLRSSLTFNGNLLNPRYILTPPPIQNVLSYPSGRQLTYGLPGSFSPDGRYWVVEAYNYGFIRLNLTTLQVVAFAANTMQNSAGNPIGAETEISPSGRYAAIVYNSGGWGQSYLKLVDVDSCQGTDAPFTATLACQTKDFWPLLKSQIPNLQSIGHAQFATDGSLNFVASTKDGANVNLARYSLTAAGQTMHLEQYLAMGDSFASGEGTFNYIQGTETAINKCHQSVFSYPYLISARVGTSASVACSGAVTDNIFKVSGSDATQLKGRHDSDITPEERSRARATHAPGFLPQMDFINNDNPEAVTVSIGGNDENIKFSDVIKQCIIPFNDGNEPSQNCYQSYEDRKDLVDGVNREYSILTQAYIKLKGSTGRRVYVIGYPQLVDTVGACGANVHLSQPERVFASKLVTYLDSVIERAAAKAGVAYVDTEDAFVGHELCDSGDKAVNGLTAGNDTIFGTGNESYHPNKLGHELLANVILAETHNLTNPMPPLQDIPNPSAADIQASALLNQPKTDSEFYKVAYDENEGDSQPILPGQSLTQFDVREGLVKPNSTMQAVLHSDPINLGTLTSDSNGNLQGDLRVPAGVSPGYHTLHLYGSDIFGDPLDVQRVVFVAASSTDYDGDGTLNADDSCVAVPNSGDDTDKDGIDDACDPTIGEAPVQIQPQAGDQSSDETVPTLADLPPVVEASTSVSAQASAQPFLSLFSSSTDHLPIASAVEGDAVIGQPKDIIQQSDHATVAVSPSSLWQTIAIGVSAALILLWIVMRPHIGRRI